MPTVAEPRGAGSLRLPGRAKDTPGFATAKLACQP